jgi:nitrate/nitrite-specific signal transduction histidine kinase
MKQALEIAIEDDGQVDYDDPELTMALRMMNYSARIIHADLQVENSELGGSRIVCTLQRRKATR